MSIVAAPAHMPVSRPVWSDDLHLAAPRVLVVEDEMAVAMLIEDIICELSFEVAAVVPRLESAMRMLDSDAFDLAMLDALYQTPNQPENLQKTRLIGTMQRILESGAK